MTLFRLITLRVIKHQEGGAGAQCDCLDINILIWHFHKNSSTNTTACCCSNTSQLLAERGATFTEHPLILLTLVTCFSCFVVGFEGRRIWSLFCSAQKLDTLLWCFDGLSDGTAESSDSVQYRTNSDQMQSRHRFPQNILRALQTIPVYFILLAPRNFVTVIYKNLSGPTFPGDIRTYAQVLIRMLWGLKNNAHYSREKCRLTNVYS